jgi:hypothetical protein
MRGLQDSVMRRLLKVLGFIITLFLVVAIGVGYYFTSLALHPAWRLTLEECPEKRQDWGKGCGNAETNGEFIVAQVEFPAVDADGFATSAWKLLAADNRARVVPAPAGAFRPGGKWAAVFFHGGGADRREAYRYARYYLSRGVDYYMPDLVCHGRSACAKNDSLSFGARESRSVKNVHAGLRAAGYTGLIFMGTSVGANSLLIALPEMPDLRAVVAENPMFSTERFVLETSAAPAFFPGPYRLFLAHLLAWRGGFPEDEGAAKRIDGLVGPPVFFIHSKEDQLIPYSHTPALYEIYGGPKELWISETGAHARVWNVNPADYEARLDAFLNRHALAR